MTDIYAELKQSLEAEELVAQVTIVAGPSQGSKMLVWPDGRMAGSLNIAAEADVLARAQELLEEQRTELADFEVGDETASVFMEVYAPPPKLIMVGAVHLSISLAKFAKELGFRTIVIDARGVFATPERFPDVDELITRWPSEALTELRLNESTCIAFLTHDEKFDNPGLEVALNSPARYVGALGSTRTHAKRVAALTAMGLTEEKINRIHAPIGLNLGGRRPEDIAVSIIAEIVAVMNGRDPKQL